MTKAQRTREHTRRDLITARLTVVSLIYDSLRAAAQIQTGCSY